jgi:hypothetical protein
MNLIIKRYQLYRVVSIEQGNERVVLECLTKHDAELFCDLHRLSPCTRFWTQSDRRDCRSTEEKQ